MYLQLGQDKAVPLKEVVGIFDIESTTVYKTTRNFLARAEKDGEIVNVSADLPKTFVICSSGGKNRVYISAVSAQTMQKKAGQPFDQIG